MRQTFAVGRLDRTSRQVLWLRRRRQPAFPGPWRVRAVVGPARPDAVGRLGAREPEPGARPPAPADSPEGPAGPGHVEGGAGSGSPPPRPSGDVEPARPQLDLFA